MMRRTRKFLALSAPDRRLALEAALALTVASLRLSLLPFRHALPGPADGAAPGPDLDPTLLRQVRQAVERAARHLPWHPLCLPQALAAQTMLRRRAISCTLHFGMRLAEPDRTLQAHAWVTAGSHNVIGVPAGDGFTELARFPA